jgi:hypothetical protein
MSKASKAKKRKPDQPSDGSMRLADHPRARRHIHQAKGWGGLAAFVLVGGLSLRAGVPFFESGMRALLGGATGYAVAWGATVLAWRHLAVAEVKAAEAKAIARRERVLQARQAQAGAGES